MKKIIYTEKQKETMNKMAQQLVKNLNKNVAEERAKICNACGHPIDKDGFCTAPLSRAD